MVILMDMIWKHTLFRVLRNVSPIAIDWNIDRLLAFIFNSLINFVLDLSNQLDLIFVW